MIANTIQTHGYNENAKYSSKKSWLQRKFSTRGWLQIQLHHFPAATLENSSASSFIECILTKQSSVTVTASAQCTTIQI